MNAGRREHPVVAFSLRIYQALLVAYPAEFQREYGSHMLMVFRDCCLRAVRQSWTNGMIRLWAVTLIDLFSSLIEEHTRKETDMTRSKFIRLSGWSLMLGAVVLFLFPLSWYMKENLYDPFRRFSEFYEMSSVMSILVSPILLAIGMLGLRIRYGDEVSGLGKNFLLLGAISGPIVTYIGAAGATTIEWIWILLYIGPAILLACLTIFGVAVISRKPLPRWNILPLLAGTWYPAAFFIAMIMAGISGEWPETPFTTLEFILFTLQCIALFLLGYILQADVPEETTELA
jgi:hypothetical protein